MFSGSLLICYRDCNVIFRRSAQFKTLRFKRQVKGTQKRDRSAIVTGTYDGGWRADRDSVQQATGWRGHVTLMRMSIQNSAAVVRGGHLCRRMGRR